MVLPDNMAVPGLGKPLVDLVEADQDTLVGLASRAFQMGLEDGAVLAGPQDSYKVLATLPGHPMRMVHRRKLRQVYGAGFDIAQAHKRIKAREQEKVDG